tara:strand:- start:111 stop:476 length:366 start_codon:yes stop_codon:yes gene_type:complete
MATLTPTLTLASTDYGSDSLNFTITKGLTVGEPTTGLSRQSIATGSAQDVLASNSAFSYLYIQNASSTNAAAFLQIKIGGNVVVRLDVNEFAFIPIYSGLTVQAEAYTAACVLEFAQFSKA